MARASRIDFTTASGLRGSISAMPKKCYFASVVVLADMLVDVALAKKSLDLKSQVTSSGEVEPKLLIASSMFG